MTNCTISHYTCTIFFLIIWCLFDFTALNWHIYMIQVFPYCVCSRLLHYIVLLYFGSQLFQIHQFASLVAFRFSVGQLFPLSDYIFCSFVQPKIQWRPFMWQKPENASKFGILGLLCVKDQVYVWACLGLSQWVPHRGLRHCSTLCNWDTIGGGGWVTLSLPAIDVFLLAALVGIIFSCWLCFIIFGSIRYVFIYVYIHTCIHTPNIYDYRILQPQRDRNVFFTFYHAIIF